MGEHQPICCQPTPRTWLCCRTQPQVEAPPLTSQDSSDPFLSNDCCFFYKGRNSQDFPQKKKKKITRATMFSSVFPQLWWFQEASASSFHLQHVPDSWWSPAPALQALVLATTHSCLPDRATHCHCSRPPSYTRGHGPGFHTLRVVPPNTERAPFSPGVSMDSASGNAGVSSRCSPRSGPSCLHATASSGGWPLHRNGCSRGEVAR